MQSTIPNLLAERYATEAIRDIWSPTGRIVLEREWWIAVLKAQKYLGLDIPVDAIASYEKHKNEVDLEAIRKREQITRHDVKARIDVFCETAGYQHIHKGMTSRDLTENVEQLQIIRSLKHIRFRAIAALNALRERAVEHRSLGLTARTHNVPAQLTTLGKRLAMFGEELLLSLDALDALIENYALRGLKGAVGTRLDMVTLFDGDVQKAQELEQKVMEELGVAHTMNATGQVYPRSYDGQVVATLLQLAAAPSSFATTLRLMAGEETASEGFLPGQVGSSAMPHKRNSRSCERINGFYVLLQGYSQMVNSIAGGQWNEGDVSCSVVRRVALPDAFFAIDGMLETFHVVLRQMEIDPSAIEAESRHYLPFLLTTTYMMQAVRNGVGREEAHERIKRHALEVMKDLQENRISANDLPERLARDSNLGLTHSDVQRILEQGSHAVGEAELQVDRFADNVQNWLHRYSDAENYRPGPIL